MKYTELKRTNTSQIMADEVIMDHGYMLTHIDSDDNHEQFRSHPCLNSSPSNSRKIWSKDGQMYIFDSWSDDWTAVKIVEVTDII